MMEFGNKNNRASEAARRRSILDEEKRIKTDTLIQEKEYREQKAAENREKEIQKPKEKAEAENQRVQAVAERKKKAQESTCPEIDKSRYPSFYGSHKSLSTKFSLSTPCSQHQQTVCSLSRRFSVDTLLSSEHLTVPPPSINSSLNGSKSKSVANLKQIFETSSSNPKSNVQKLAQSIRKAAIKQKPSNFPPTSFPQISATQSKNEILDEIYRLESNISKTDETIMHLEDYVDNLLCRIIEKCPHLLQSD